jgi:hypothetical protein
MKAAKLLGVPPWDLLKRPIYWMIWALEMESIEAEVIEAMRPKTRTQ